MRCHTDDRGNTVIRGMVGCSTFIRDNFSRLVLPDSGSVD